MALDAELDALIAPVVEAVDLEYWGLEHTAEGNKKIVRVFVDHADGVNVDQCAEVSRQLSSLFDVEDPIPGVYTLEVSSPGLERPLFKLEHYQQFVGHELKVKLRFPFEGRRKYKGVLTAIEGDEVCLLVEDHEYLLPIESIEKANLVYRFQ